MKKHFYIKVSGLVQGVGFRPFIYRLAQESGLSGTVENRNDGVHIHLSATAAEAESFAEKIREKAPPAAVVKDITIQFISDHPAFLDFTITGSASDSDRITEVSPDIAVCNDCLEDMKKQPHRQEYPFINCTNCGPRFTIIRELPYDRPSTTMAAFPMCSKCGEEYHDPSDRRFHAQPVACNDCGPVFSIHGVETSAPDYAAILEKAAAMLHEGKTIAVKGLGGFFLCCNALDEAAVVKLRESKLREAKPFAVMFRDLTVLEEYTQMNAAEKELITSWRRPVVLLKQKQQLCESLNRGLNTVGAMLPYLPLHYQLFEVSDLEVLVMTSGNLSDAPIIKDNDAAEKFFPGIASAIITHNRDIYNRCDDSVAFVAAGKPRLIRRSRGYAPAPIDTGLNCDGIFAAGAELKNCFAIGKGHQIIPSQHIGDLKDASTFDFYTESAERLMELFRVKPEIAVCDTHPDYLSTRYAESLNIPLIRVQHHHAHIASVMAEHGTDEKLLGISFDGTGLGSDGHIWGSEFLICDLESFERVSHLSYLPMPGGDASAKDSSRMAVSWLFSRYGRDFMNLDIPFVRSLKPEKTGLMIQAIEKSVNCPLSSGCGRYFDAVAALTGLCSRQQYDAQAPMLLEAIAHPGAHHGSYPFTAAEVIDSGTIIEEIVNDLIRNVPVPVIAARFHNTLVSAIFAVAETVKRNYGITTVALSGGSFMNRILLEKTTELLTCFGYRVLSNSMLPSNDGGIAAGQLAVAAKMRK